MEVCEELSEGEKKVLPLVTEVYSKIRQAVESIRVSGYQGIIFRLGSL